MWSIFAICFLTLTQTKLTKQYEPISWKWTCEGGRLCTKWQKGSNTSEHLAVSLQVCKMFCTKYGSLWPRPKDNFTISGLLVKVNIARINVHIVKMGKSSGLLVAAGLRFKNIVTRTMSYRANISPIARDIDVFLNVTNPDVIEFSLEMDESYHLNVTLASIEKINVTITGSTFFGVRHGLETLSQLFIYDDHRKFPLIVSSASIHDSPKYTYRGLMLDTSRNYYPVSSIKRTIDAMAMVKMNSFHWHITDSQSFPFVSERRPNMSRIGAYSPSKVYTKKVIQDISRFALVRGVRVVPELDAPAHVGEGWQGTNLTVCFNVEPWEVYCGEPPCGQLNPIDDNVYNYLEDIYTDMAEAFVTTDLFHMGSDEVNERCWRSYEPIENYMRGNFYLEQTSFVEMWSFFQKKAHYKVYKAFKTKIPLVIWSSTLTNSYTVEEYLDVKEYIIQIWTGSGDVQVRTLLNKGFKLILSNPEQLYLDCGFGGWLEEGENWCTPYKSWKVIYEHNPSDIAGSRCHLILGSEAALWSEEADAGNLDSRLWPRLGALAERLWSDPTSSWRDAEQRMLHLKQRLTRMGIHTEVLQPEWCYYNEGKCIRVPKTYRLVTFDGSAVIAKANSPYISATQLMFIVFLNWFIEFQPQSFERF